MKTNASHSSGCLSLDVDTPCAIRPDLLAGKLAAIRRLEFPRFAARMESEPRLAELLNFIQWQSMQPAGLAAFARQLLEAFPGRIGTQAMRRFGKTRGRYSLAELASIWKELPIPVQWDLFPSARALFHSHDDLDADHIDYRLTLLLGSENPDSELAAYAATDRRDLQAEVRESLARLTPEFLFQKCRASAIAELPRRLSDLCVEMTDNFEAVCEFWCFGDLPGALLEFMDRHAVEARTGIAKTKVAAHVHEGLDYALEMGRAVMIRGATGLGKSESIQAYALARPGVVRIVRQPPGNSLVDMLARIAQALGIYCPPSTARRVIQEKVDFVLRHCRFFLIFDESHHLVAESFKRTGAPVRLNWVRDAVMDAGLPCALISTPQDFQKRLSSFVSATRYNVDQFLRRVEMWPDLPAQNESEDLEAVAALHFAQFKESLRMFVVGVVMEVGGGPSGVVEIATLSAFYAKRAGRIQPAWEDVQRAAGQFKRATKERKLFSGLAQDAQEKRACKPTARRSQTVCGSDFEAVESPQSGDGKRSVVAEVASHRLMSTEPDKTALLAG